MALKADKADLLARFEAALRLSGWRVLWLNESHPAKARLFKNQVGVPEIDAWVHIWNLTPGGRSASMPNERRIQPTGIQGYFRSSPNVRTLILGWSTETGVFAAFDQNYHSTAFGKSPSIQTDLPTLIEASDNGLGVFEKGTGELSIAVRPDMLALYVEQMQVLHASGKDLSQLNMLRRMASDPLNVEADDLPKSRRKVLVTTLRVLRDRRFGEQVLTAYGHRCALCGVQLQLLDAAHILPVAHPDSNDRVTNGVALCALHHRAYDAGLVTFDIHFSIKVSKPSVDHLARAGRHGGLKPFKAALRTSLLLPKAKSNYPSSQMINKANKLRGW